MLNSRFALTLSALLIGLVSSLAHAEQADKDQPIHVTADSGYLDQLKGITQGDGNVVLTQGTMTIHADHATVTRNQQGEQTVLATGKLVTFRQKVDDTPTQKNVWVEGQAKRADYDTVSHILKLTTDARVKKGDDLVVGDAITYNTVTQIYQSQGGENSTSNKGRVTVVIQPQKKNASGK